MIYLFDQLNSFSDELFWRSLKVVPPQRAQKALSFKYMIDRKLSVIAYLLLIYGIQKEYGILEELVFEFGENEKPYLKNHPNIFFNISHCKSGVVCAISNEEIGIDIEQVTNFDEEVAKYICNETEYNHLIQSPKQSLDFCKLWTAKESAVKLTGKGICTDLKSLLNNINVKIETIGSRDKRYVISVCRKAHRIGVCGSSLKR